MEEYNLLTQRLLAEGYTAENHPDYVRLQRGWDKTDPLINLCGGFEYTAEYRNKLVFKTGCGLLIKGSNWSYGNMSYMGILWSPENNNPVVCCPFRKDACDSRNQILGGPRGGGLSKLFQCDCHQVDEPYDYEKSIEKAREERQEEERRKYDAFSARAKGHVCHWHMHYNDWTGEWSQRYDPMTCARNCLNVGKTCDLTGEPISKKRGNVFYDVKVSYIRHDGTLFDGEEVVQINKGIRFLNHPASMTICEQIVKHCADEIRGRAESAYSKEILLRGYKVDVLNIRAEQRESRDLMQDLQDIQEGIRITHASDLVKQEKAQKHERREAAKEQRIKKLEKKLIEDGYDNLPEFSLDRAHAEKWLGWERIEELEEIRKHKLKEEQEKPVQLSLFDLMEAK